jgi:Xaa-Pro dipeptidase
MEGMDTSTSATWQRAFSEHLHELNKRTATALAASQFESLLLYSGRDRYWFLDDATYPFKAHPPFKVWAPLTDAPECFVFVVPGHKPVLVFHQADDFWHKPATVPEAYWTSHFDIRIAKDTASARAALPADLSRTAFIGEAFAELATFGVAAVNPEHLLARLDFPRARKSEYELLCLREASRMAARGHVAAAAAFAAGASEFDVGLAYQRAARQREKHLPYNPIIALNEGGAVLHYQVQELAAPAAHHSMLIDAGCEFGGYASDITRTHSFEDRDWRELITRFDALQLQLCAAVKPGVEWSDVHELAHHSVADFLREADIVTTPASATVESGLSRVFFPHGIGHLLGIQVHDVGGTLGGPDGRQIPRPGKHPSLRLTRRLEAGFVVTMEPGIYFIDALLTAARSAPYAKDIRWSRVAALHKFGGIRIEDDLAVTPDGCENLTRDAFASVSAS